MFQQPLVRNSVDNSFNLFIQFKGLKVHRCIDSSFLYNIMIAFCSFYIQMMMSQSLISLIGFYGFIVVCSGNYSGDESYTPPASPGYEQEYYPDVVKVKRNSFNINRLCNFIKILSIYWNRNRVQTTNTLSTIITATNSQRKRRSMVTRQLESTRRFYPTEGARSSLTKLVRTDIWLTLTTKKEKR